MPNTLRCDICGTLIKTPERPVIKNSLIAYHEYCYYNDIELDPKQLKTLKTQKYGLQQD